MPFYKAIIKWAQSKAVTLGLSYYGNVNWHLFTSFRKLVTNFDDKIAKILSVSNLNKHIDY